MERLFMTKRPHSVDALGPKDRNTKDPFPGNAEGSTNIF